MPRGGARPGAGRPRKTDAVRKQLSAMAAQEDGYTKWGWHQGELICAIRTGEHAMAAWRALMQRLGNEENLDHAELLRIAREELARANSRSEKFVAEMALIEVQSAKELVNA